jgi:hypothetical protein
MPLKLVYSGFLDPRVGEITMFHRFQGTAGNLTYLILANVYEFSKKIPTEIGALTKLDALLWNDNDVTGIIQPSRTTHLSNLEVHDVGCIDIDIDWYVLSSLRYRINKC